MKKEDNKKFLSGFVVEEYIEGGTIEIKYNNGFGHGYKKCK